MSTAVISRRPARVRSPRIPVLAIVATMLVIAIVTVLPTLRSIDPASPANVCTQASSQRLEIVTASAEGTPVSQSSAPCSQQIR